MSQVSVESDFRYVEETSEGVLIRYGVIPIGYTQSGERILTFGSSLFSSRPTVVQVLKSLSRYAEAFADNESVLRSLETQDLSVYFDNSLTFGR